VGVAGWPVIGRRRGRSQHYCGGLDCGLPLMPFWQQKRVQNVSECMLVLALCLVHLFIISRRMVCADYIVYCFWVTVCKTVRRMLSDRCPSVCLSVLSYPVLSVTLVYCRQTVGRIKTKLGMQV